MPALKPFELKEKTGIIGMIAVLTAVLALILKWKDAYAFIVPDGKWLNWRFTIALALGVGLIVGIIMNVLWLKEYKNHTQTKYERDNLKTLLDLSEKKSMQDVTTGLPNGEKLIADIQKIITSRKESRNMQAILIDIKDFRSINKRHGFLKGDEILRRVAQSIQKSIRRNEDMYMAPLEQELWENVYRRYPGGDEFIFLIEGDQAAAVGFVVNRLLPSFKELTEIMPQPQLLGHKFNLSFDCAIVNAPPGVSPTTVFRNIGKCYARATQGKKDFNICWTPQNLENELEETDYRRAFYRKAYSTFDVMSIDENELSST